MTPILIGIDDTDNPDTRGTGYRARCLAAELEQAGLARIRGITRHQLLLDDRVPYTSHNSSACLGVEADEDLTPVIAYCRDYLLRIAARGSDVGLCVTTPALARAAAAFGTAAQTVVLERSEAEELAAERGIHLEGLTGDYHGVIGALAAVALHASGNDGRYLWVRNIRELTDQTVTVADLLEKTGVEIVMQMDNSPVNDLTSTVALGHWPRPVPVDGRAALLVEANNGADANWKVVAKETVKAYRP